MSSAQLVYSPQNKASTTNTPGSDQLNLTNISANTFIATPTTVYMDSRATNHVTFELDHISIRTDYTGKQQLQVENWELLNISHTGSSNIYTLLPNKFLSLT